MLTAGEVQGAGEGGVGGVHLGAVLDEEPRHAQHAVAGRQQQRGHLLAVGQVHPGPGSHQGGGALYQRVDTIKLIALILSRLAPPRCRSPRRS